MQGVVAKMRRFSGWASEKHYKAYILSNFAVTPLFIRGKM
jgi:hypothetical protein